MTISALEFFPGEHAPQGCNHGGGLADRIGNRHPGEIRGHQIKDRAGAPDDPTHQTEQVAGGGPAKEFAEIHGLAHERVFHKIDIPDKTRQQRSEREENAGAVGTQGVSLGHRMSDKWRPQAHQDSRDNADQDALTGS
ncbi:MAG: hypothetical protein DMG54_27850 [Acidobacteria bacterium]|nr:MAG: hypothetical protein DMG54_27850 [Acidobacteriota bacterium]